MKICETVVKARASKIFCKTLIRKNVQHRRTFRENAKFSGRKILAKFFAKKLAEKCAASHHFFASRKICEIFRKLFAK